MVRETGVSALDIDLGDKTAYSIMNIKYSYETETTTIALSYLVIPE